jgi:hypothetical protein
MNTFGMAALALLLFCGCADAWIPAHRNMKVICGGFTIWIVYGDRTGKPKVDGSILRLDVTDRGLPNDDQGVLTIKWGTNFWGGWVKEGSTLGFLGRWQDNKLSWSIQSPDGYPPDLYTLRIRGKTGTFTVDATEKLVNQCRVEKNEWEPAREGTP